MFQLYFREGGGLAKVLKTFPILGCLLLFQNCSQSFVEDPGSTLRVPSRTSFSIGEKIVLYDPSSDSLQNCGLHLDSPFYPLSFSDNDQVRVRFSGAVNSRETNFAVLGRISSANVLNSLQADCANPMFYSNLSPRAADYAGAGWFSSFTKSSVGDVYAIIHDEYYGGGFGQNSTFPLNGSLCPSGITDQSLCWNSSILQAKSSDGGKTFNFPDGVPTQKIAIPPGGYQYTGRAYGYKINTNVFVRGSFYYIYLEFDDEQGRPRICPMRTATIDQASSWRGWDGKDFTRSLPTGEACVGIDIDVAPFYIGYNSYLNCYILVGTDVNSPFHITYLLSDDLLTWRGKTDLGVSPLWSPDSRTDSGGWGRYNYPTLLDIQALQNNQDINASTGGITGRRPYLVFIDKNIDGSRDRVIAQPLEFKIEAE